MAKANFLAPLRASFVNGSGGQRLTEDQIKNRDLIARALLQNATDTSPTAGGWASILAKGAAGLASNYQQTNADNAVNANAKAASDADSAFYSSLSGQLGGAPAGVASALPAPAASGQMAATSPGTPPPPEIQSLIAEVVPPELQSYATNLVGKESRFDPNAVSPTGATGLAQFTKGTGRQYGLINDAGDFRSDPRANLNALVRLTNDNKAGLTAALGRAPTDGELALAHQQGLDGAISLLNGKAVPGQNLAVNNIDPNSDPRAAAQKIMAFYGGAGGQPAAAIQSPNGYVDPQVSASQPSVASSLAAPAISPVAQALVAQPQDTSATALPLTDTLKGGRLGQPSITQQNFNARMGGQASPAFDPSTIQDYGTQEPQQAQPQAAAPAFTLPAPRLPPAPQPLNPAVIQALQNPSASPQTKQVAAALLNQYSTQKQAYQEQVLKAQQQQQRASIAQHLGLDPSVALDEDLWKEAVKSQSTGGGIINAGDGRLYNSRTKEWIEAPNASTPGFRAANPDEVKSFGTNGQVDTKTGRFYPVTPPQGTSLSVDPQTGAVSFNQGAGVKPMTEGQSKDSFFTTRMTAAMPTLNANEQALTSFGEKNAGSLPAGLGNYLQSEQFQLANGAGKDFVMAYLRKDSGAAISPQEEKAYGELLLPQPGDSPSVIAAKAQRRQVAVEAIKSGMPQQALDGVIKAIKSVPGADKPNMPQTTSSGVTWSVK